MKILFNVGHPAHVHLFKNAIKILEQKGHNIKIAAVDKDITVYLLNVYGFDHSVIGKNESSILKKALGLFEKEYSLFKIANQFDPDLLVSTGSPYAAHVSRLMKRPHIVFGDVENAGITTRLMLPFTEAIYTPSCFERNLGQIHIKYDGCHELAYLHPNYFKPDPTVLDDLNINKDKLIILRFVSWNATHDFQHKGINSEIMRKIIEKFEDIGSKVFISSEKELETYFKKYELKIKPEKMHSLLYYADLYFGEGAKMASESAILGTPSIYVNPLKLGFLNELEKYNMIYICDDISKALEKGMEMVKDNYKIKLQEGRNKFLNEKIDVTKFIIQIIDDCYNKNLGKKKYGRVAI